MQAEAALRSVLFRVSRAREVGAPVQFWVVLRRSLKVSGKKEFLVHRLVHRLAESSISAAGQSIRLLRTYLEISCKFNKH